MRKTLSSLAVSVCAVASGASSFAQGLPSTQPKFLHIIREQVKAGRAIEHSQFEAGFVAAFEKAKATTSWYGLASLTGPQEVWYVIPYASQAAYGETTAWEESQPGLSAELERLYKADAEFVSESTAVQAVAAPQLSHGNFPDLAKMRYWEITTFRMRPGHEDAWITATMAYKAAATRGAPNASWRTYRVVAGAPDPTYIVFSSVAAFGDFDRMLAEGENAMKGATSEEMSVLGQFMKESVLSVTTNRYRLDPRQSYVDAATKAKDPAFWNPRK